MLKIIVIVLLVLVAGYFFLRWLLPALSPRPDGLGVENGRLSSCPDKPNCVSTFASDQEHGMEPLTYDGGMGDAHQQISSIIKQMDGTTIIISQPDYLYAEFRTPRLNLIDDVEFLFDDENKIIQFRSASRLGYSDFGVNRERMEAIVTAYNR